MTPLSREDKFFMMYHFKMSHEAIGRLTPDDARWLIKKKAEGK